MSLMELATAAILAKNGIEPILQFTTRDRNRIALQGDLLGGWALDIPNILCLYGDEVKGGDQPDTKEVRDLDTIGLLKTAHEIKINKMYPSGRKIMMHQNFSLVELILHLKLIMILMDQI